MAPELTGLRVGDEPTAWADAGFSVHGGLAVIDGVRVELLGERGRRGLVSWSLTGAETDSIDGLETTPPGSTSGTDDDTRRPDDEHDGFAHPNGTVAIDHVVVASPNLTRTTAALATVDVEVRRTRDTDQYGAPMRQVFFRLGRPILELIGAPDASGDGPASFWGLALTVTDLDATKELLGDRLGEPKDAVQPGRRIATLRHKALGLSVPIAFMSG